MRDVLETAAGRVEVRLTTLMQHQQSLSLSVSLRARSGDYSSDYGATTPLANSQQRATTATKEGRTDHLRSP